MPTIVGRLTGATFQTELLVMNLLGLVNNLRNWKLGWTNQVDAIESSQHLGGFIKFILCWIVKTRIIIQQIYTITYLVNFYSILTWCRGKSLLPWMIVSAIDNFILESLSFVITLLLYQEKSISSALFIEYMIVRAIPRVPAVYYWCIVKLFRANLDENLRRKLTQVNFNVHRSVFQISDITEHMRSGGVSYNKDYCEKLPRFASLPNLDDSLWYSLSSKFDDEQDFCKRTKSLFTVMSIDSSESDDPDDCRILRIPDDSSLTPTEKAMKILNINDSDINETRMRLGKNTLAGPSKVEKIDNVILAFEQSVKDVEIESTDNVTTNEETLPEKSSSLGNIEDPTENEIMVRKGEEDKTTSKVRSHDKIHDENVSKISARNPLSGCICGGEADGGPVRANFPDSDDDLEKSSDESHGCQEEVDDDSNRDIDSMRQLSNTSEKPQIGETESSEFFTTSLAQLDLADDAPLFPEWSSTDYLESVLPPRMSQQLPLKSMLIRSFREKENEVLNDHFQYPENIETANYQLFRIDDITVEQHGNSENISDAEIIEDQIIEDMPAQETLNDIRRTEKRDAQPTDESFPTVSAAALISTQPNSIDLWENSLKHDKKRPDVSIDQQSMRRPIAHYSHLNFPDHLSETDKLFCRFSRMKRKSEKINDREAREMKALRVYNKLTLLEDRREMEAKKSKSSFSNWIGIQDLIYKSDFTNHTMRELRELRKSLADNKDGNRVRREKLDHVRRTQTRSRPKEKTSKLSAFNVQIDALKASISSGFSNDKKIRRGRQNINPHDSIVQTNQDTRKQLSKYSQPIKLQEDENVSYQLSIRSDDIKEDQEIVRFQKDENPTDNIPLPVIDRRSSKHIFPRTILTSSNDANLQHDGATEMVYSPGTIEEVRNTQRISSMREAIMSINWDFNGRIFSEMNFVTHHESFDWRHEDFLWDILDETDTITLLQSAFSSNPENTSRGFYLGPGSTELYYVSNFLDGVVEEIMKTVRLRVRNDARTIQTTSEIDYGYSYLQEFTVTGIKTGQDDSEDTLTDSDSATDETLFNNETNSFTANDPEKVCWNNHSANSLEVQPNNEIEVKVIEGKDIHEEEDIEWKYLQQWTSKHEEKKSITDILGHQELSQLEYWTRELKKLASNDHRSDSFEFTRHMQHLTALPGFYVVQKIMDFFRDFVAVSRSTMTPAIFLTENETEPSIPSSSTDMTNQSNLSSILETPNDSLNMRTVSGDVDNSAHYYFGTLDDRHFLANETLPSGSNVENHPSEIDANEERDGLHQIKTKMIPEDIQAYPMVTQSPPGDKRENGLRDLFPASSIIETSSQLRNNDATRQDVQHPFQTDRSGDSYDSLYSAAGNSNCSNNTVSIGYHSSMEEFSLEPSNPTDPRLETPNDITHAEINH